jgi:hypothetical protein
MKYFNNYGVVGGYIFVFIVFNHCSKLTRIFFNSIG